MSLRITDTKKGFAVSGTQANDAYGRHLKTVLGGRWNAGTKSWDFFEDKRAEVMKYVNEVNNPPKVVPPRRASPRRTASPPPAPAAQRLTLVKHGKTKNITTDWTLTGTLPGDGHAKKLKALGAFWIPATNQWRVKEEDYPKVKAYVDNVNGVSKEVPPTKVGKSLSDSTRMVLTQWVVANVDGRASEALESLSDTLGITEPVKREGEYVHFSASADRSSIVETLAEYQDIGRALAHSLTTKTEHNGPVHHYFFRSEAPDDIEAISKLLGAGSNINEDGEDYHLTTPLQFVEVIKLIDQVPDGHVMADTLTVEGNDYDGVRAYIGQYTYGAEPTLPSLPVKKSVQSPQAPAVAITYHFPAITSSYKVLEALKSIITNIPTVGRVDVSFQSTKSPKEVIDALLGNGLMSAARFLQTDDEYKRPPRYFYATKDPAVIKQLSKVLDTIPSDFVSTHKTIDGAHTGLSFDSSLRPQQLVDAFASAGLDGSKLILKKNYDMLGKVKDRLHNEEFSIGAPGITVTARVASPTKVASGLLGVEYLDSASLFELWNNNREFDVDEGASDLETRVNHFRILGARELLEPALASVVSLEAFGAAFSMSDRDLASALWAADVPYVRGMTRTAAAVALAIAGNDEMRDNASYRGLSAR